jgi:predicted dehydrogenase
MSKKVAVGLLGGGLITQVEHLPNLLGLPYLFDVRGVADPSDTVRTHLANRYGVPVFSRAQELLDQPLDAVVIAAPDGYHVDLTLEALRRGLHVFCEKPLCYLPQDADRIAAQRDTARRVVQVGYMKRFDPSWLLLRDLIKGQSKSLRMISVEVNDPDFWPYVAHRDYVSGGVLPELAAEGAALRDAQIARTLGSAIAGPNLKAFANSYCSSMVHDVNAVHGLLDALGMATSDVVGAALYANGEGGQATMRLTPGDAIFSAFHLTVPKLADYHERITLYFDDRIFELGFPSPYLNHHPTTLIEKRSHDHHAEAIAHRASYKEPFVEEMRAWHAAMTEGATVLNTVEDARRDMLLFQKLGHTALSLTD